MDSMATWYWPYHLGLRICIDSGKCAAVHPFTKECSCTRARTVRIASGEINTVGELILSGPGERSAGCNVLRQCV